MRNVRKISKKYYLRQIVACFLVYCLFFSPAVMAEVVLTGYEPGNPIEVTPLGTGDIQAITNDLGGAIGDGAIGYFSDFDIALGDTVNCLQNAGSNALFKVNSGDGTQIFGIFNTDGNIYLQDLSGILIGSTGQINANSFIVSTLDIKNTDWKNFIAGLSDQLPFARGVEDPISNVENQGTITALSNVYLVGSSVINSGTITAPDLLVMAAGDKVYLKQDSSNVVVDVEMNFSPSHVVDNDSTIEAPASKVILAAGDIFSAALNVDSLAAKAFRDITLEGAVTANGDITLVADADGFLGGNVDAQVLDAGGNVDISASDTTINLHDDVTAGIDIFLNNNTVADAGIALTAGQNVDIAAGKTVTALGSLGIEATGGEIMADTSIIDMAADGQTLSLKQNAGMDLEQDFSVNNRTNTDLVADSTGGSVTSDAAGEWKSITAHAADNITLSDISEVITTEWLTADNGDVKVTSIDGKVKVYGPISAGQDVIITATDEGLGGSEDAISLYGAEGGKSIVAGRDIWLNNNTWLASNYLLDAGQDVRVGWQGDQSPWDPADGYYAAKKLTGAGALTIEADRHITLGGDVETVGDLTLWADKDDDGEPGGDMTALGNITSTEGSIDIYASDSTIILTGDKVEASGYVTLHDNTILDGGNQQIDALTGKLITDNGVDVDKITAGNVDFGGGSGIDLGGNVTGTGMTSVDSLIFKNDVTAYGTGDAEDQRFDAGLGALWAKSTITKNDGDDLTLGADQGLDLDGTVDVQTTSGSLYIEDDFTAAGDLLANSYLVIRDPISNNGEWVNGEFDGVGNQKVEARNAGLSVNTDEYPDSDEPYLKKTKPGNLELRSAHSLSLHSHVTVEEGELIINGGTHGSGVTLMGNLWSSGNMTLTSNGGGLGVEGNAKSESGSVEMTANGYGIRLYSRSWGRDVEAGQDIVLNDDTTIYYSNAVLDAGDDVEAFGTVAGQGDLTINAGTIESGSASDYANIRLHQTVTVEGSLVMTAGDDIEAADTLMATGTNGSGNMILNAGDDIDLDGTAVSAQSGGLMELIADLDPSNGTGDVDVAGSLEGNMKLSGTNVYVNGTVTSHDTLDVDADDDIVLQADVSSVGEMMMDAGSDIELNRNSGNTSSESTISLNAGDSITIGKAFAGNGNVTANGNMDIFAGGDSEDNVKVYGKLTTTNGGNIDVTAGGDIKLYGSFVDSAYESAQADGDLTLDAGDDVCVLGDLISNNGSIELSSDNTTTYLAGDVTAAIDVTLNNNTEFYGCGDQKVDAQAGMITARGWLLKDSYSGSLYLEAAGDISLSGDVVVYPGGVSIISEEGKIFTPDECGYETDTLNVYIEGYSDQLEGDGVSLPLDPDKKAAIVIISKEDLKLGPDSQLIANGYYIPLHAIDIEGIETSDDYDNFWDELYYEFGDVIWDLEDGFNGYLDDLGYDGLEDIPLLKELLGDYLAGLDDRPAIGFLAEPGSSIGGIIRDEGDPIDVAVYLQSETGNVDVESELISVNYNGTMVVDAYDTVRFGDLTSEPAIQTVESVEVREGRFWEIDRLEVVSRLTEWLFEADAFGTLPYPYNPEIVEAFIGGKYVLRGAGLGNPDILDGRAWVLEDPLDPAPLYEEAGEAADEEEFGEGGCPALMDWLAAEIGVPAEDIQVTLAGALALNTDIQPCEMCTRLMGAATTLEDVDGTQIAAMARVVNEFVTTPAPPSPEQMTQIAAVLSEHVGDGTYYALAGEWIDALVAYVGIMNTEMGYSASDASAFANKYLTPVTETGNTALIAYVQARLAALGG